MRRGLVFISFILFSYYSSAQNPVKIKRIGTSSGESGIATYAYSPPPNLSIRESLFAYIVYEVEEENYLIRKPLKKVNGNYQLSFSPPATVKAFVLTITDSKQRTIDNNMDSGYTILCNKKPGEIAAAKLEAAWLLSYYAPLKLHLDRIVLLHKMVDLHEEAYRLSPGLKQDLVKYRYYLLLHYQKREDAAKPGLLAYAKKMEKKNDEASMATALYIYRFLLMDTAMLDLEIAASASFPKEK